MEGSDSCRTCKAVEVVVLVALGDAGGGNAALLALEFLAIAGAGNPETGGGLDADQAEAAADGTGAHGLFPA